MAKKKSTTWLRPEKEFPTQLFMITIGVLMGIAVGAYLVSSSIF